MIEQLRKHQLPIFAGLALGAGIAFYFTRMSPIKAESLCALSAEKFTPLPLLSSSSISPDTRELVFKLPKSQSLNGNMHPAYMVLFKHEVDGTPLIKPYTPISRPNELGQATFVIKNYAGSAMTNWVTNLKPGQTVEMKGPIQKYQLLPNQHKRIALIGGGTGITPLYQILEKVALDPQDTTKVDLYFGNQTPQDVLLKSEIEALVAKKPNQLSATFFVNNGSDNWKGEVGFITKDYLQTHLFKPSDENVKVFVCGPPAMYNAISGNKVSATDQGVLTGALKDLGFDASQVFKF